MKDIKHYFADVSKSSENTSISLKEVRVERAKIDDTTIDVANEESKVKKKRGRVKIKISRKSNEGAVCNIIESSTDLVDKTPSPYPKPKKKQIISSDDTPKRKTASKSTSNLNLQGSSSLITKQSHKNNQLDVKKQSNELISGKCNNSVENTSQINEAKMKEIKDGSEEDTSSIKIKRTRQKHTEKLLELANKKGYSKRKIKEEEEATKIEKRLEKRKKMFIIGPQKNTEEIQSDENCPKNNDSCSTKHSSNLLSYFSKATPDQLEKERLMNTKVTVKAEIHTPQNSPVSTVFISEKKKQDSLKKAKLKSKQQQEEIDEILLIQSETVVLSPKNEKLKSSVQHNKPKWSMKIQLQSNNNIPVSDIENDDEEIYTPTVLSKPQKENIKNNDKISKILLPVKNKRESINSSLDESADNGKKEDRKNIKINKGEKSKTEKLETEMNNKIDCFTIKECKANDIIAEIKDDECQIIEENSLKRKSKEKLAPLFTKRIKPNPDIVAARRLFLQSDIHENENSNENRKSEPSGPIILPFPRISHVTQLCLNKVISNEKYNFQLKKDKKFKPSFNSSHMKITSKLNNATYIFENLYECIKSDIETTLSEIELYCSDVRTLWKTISISSKCDTSNRALKSKRRISDKNNIKHSNDNLRNELLNSPWTDKYKPNSSAEVVGNEEAASKLKSWLDSWKSLKTIEGYSSSEEFYTSDCSMSSNIENNQVAVLIGPHGSGKTASVYAVARELGYKVLEVNASSKRPGKKILKEFEEATKSHRVKKSNLKDIFVSKSKVTEETKKVSQNSLILMEDIDLVFEEDEGFVSAAFQLASNTKRPIVMTLTDTCSHLCKMAPQQFLIHFQPVTGKRVTALLQLIALAETGCKISQNCADAFCQDGDLRKGLLQLQYLLLSRKEHFTKNISLISLAVNNLSWKDMRIYIYKPAIKIDKSKKKKHMLNDKNLNNKLLENLASNLDNFSLISRLNNVEDPTSHLLDLKCEPSISLIENMTSYSNLENVSLEIGNWLNNTLKKSVLNNANKLNCQLSTINYSLLTQKQINIGVDSALSQIALNILDRQALAVDYLASIRTICRAEEIRNQLNNKRGNRFFHYLQSSRLSSGTTKFGNILSAACKMLQEKSATIAEI